MAKKVYLGVGHGGKDPGAVAFGRKEKDMALDIAKACRDELVRHGVNVMLSRESDVSENLASRIEECNAFNPDLAADIHLNAGKGDGAEVFHSKADTSDDVLAKNILDEITKIGQNSRGLKVKLLDDGRDYFGFVRQIKCDSVLVECAFIDNATDVKIVDTLAERKAMGVAIAKGILKTLGITYKEPAKTNSFLTARGYLTKGDSGNSVQALCDFFANQVKGNYFGDYLEACVKVFQKQNALEQDGNVGPLTLAELKKHGFKVEE